VVRALAARPGFAGCAISDREGLLLAQSRIDDSADAVSAIVPRMLKQVCENMAEVADGAVQSVSVCVETRMFTVVASGRVFLTALHEANRLTMGQFKLIKRVAGELAWLLCHRGYVAS
jgi:predicted regulator of Ras-like GTPase activity (Roadblock/LC7/MglB family)